MSFFFTLNFGGAYCIPFVIWGRVAMYFDLDTNPKGSGAQKAQTGQNFQTAI